MSIAILPARLANQIAAGEVVERPASVVKELVENSLDAGATRIRVDIERGGHKLIRITDNGSGIVKDELTLALSRHATSKLKTLDDLECINSLGFRGEALASISSVSRLTLKSKPAQQNEAWQAFAEGRDMAVQVQPTAHPDGTTIEVKDLFFNTPARRKFLRTEKTEFNHIDELLKRIALSRFDIAITLTHNAKVVRQYRPVSADDVGAVKRIAQVAGKGFASQGMHLQSGDQGLYLHGWIMPQHTQTEPQYTYVNGRMMRDKLILHAIRQAFEEHTQQAQVPAFVLYLEVDPRQVDVNVHPAKHEVRFHQARLVHDFILQAVQQLVANEQTLIPQPSIPPATAAHSDSPAYPKSQLRPSPDNQQSGQFMGTASRPGSSYRDSAPASTRAHPVDAQRIAQANQFYQGISEVQAYEFNHVAESAPAVHVAAESVSLLPLTDGHCAVSVQGQLHLSHWRQVLPLAWQQQLEAEAQLSSRALLLPVRVALQDKELACLQGLQSWLSVLGFDIQLEKQFAMVKRLPSSLYASDAKRVIEQILSAQLTAESSQQDFLTWLAASTPSNYFNGNDFATWQTQLQNTPEIVQQLQQKAVKIELSQYVSQLSV
ncbi:DNA mismatch repair endonuclease MutL [Pseudoalteromonas sp. CNC9-20]|uniref:DNA mismatch repair endonuclease MutL n=1 Tax=Pseudoalteromonas sp. CNC9-20 TaxID=2917750 RepID=UPI001EF743EB|nr:DNA mismatch repair endonuclease MutL [Pseudoalteromonas sp. CNC9-20]MCG7570482.1 DNA mismatch repair endonuclease MutL [Pseudoalteromonas sp. CNC9-20]